MMRKQVAGSLALSILGVLVVALVLVALGDTGAAQGPDGYSTYYVAPSCSGMPTPCYTVVQDAVDDVDDPGDVVQIAQGTYSDVHVRSSYTQAVYLTRTVTIRGGYAPGFGAWDPDLYPTTLDAQRQGHVFTIFGAGSPVIEGLTITGGDTDLGGGNYGGGILAVGNSGPALTVTLRYNQVISNYAGTSFGGGGGLGIIFTNLVMEDNIIQHNQAAGTGGGMRLEQTNADLTNTIWRDNTSASSGGAIYAGNLASVAMTNTVLIDNDASTAGGALVAAAAYVEARHSTVARNTSGDGSAIYVTGGFGPGTVLMVNSILASHDVGVYVWPSPPDYTNSATLDYALWDGVGVLNSGGGSFVATNTLVGSPGFCSDGYHICPASDAIDQAVPAGVAFDIDRQPRPARAGYDLGADEMYLSVYLPVVVKGAP
ncbi:MAG: hypothetical protein M8467_18685 [Anaerolineae bacterium]|nr:hypothetical protein [Anaerolineae bacterium]